MRAMTKVLAGVTAVALAATMTACSSSSSGGGKKSQSAATDQVKKLTGGMTAVALNPAFVAQLGGLNLIPTAFGTAKLTVAGTASQAVFPITGGTVTIPASGAVAGTIDHQGSGLTFTSGSTKVTVDNFVVHLGAASNLTAEVQLNGAVAFKSLVLFDLEPGTQAPVVTNSGVVLKGTKIYLSSDAATDLNAALGTKTLAGGKTILIGTATFTATSS
jgi:hypothetical protein